MIHNFHTFRTLLLILQGSWFGFKNFLQSLSLRAFIGWFYNLGFKEFFCKKFLRGGVILEKIVKKFSVNFLHKIHIPIQNTLKNLREKCLIKMKRSSKDLLQLKTRTYLQEMSFECTSKKFFTIFSKITPPLRNFLQKNSLNPKL